MVTAENEILQCKFQTQFQGLFGVKNIADDILFCNYTPNFATFPSLLREVAKKNAALIWKENHQNATNQLRNLSSAPKRLVSLISKHKKNISPGR